MRQDLSNEVEFAPKFFRKHLMEREIEVISLFLSLDSWRVIGYIKEAFERNFARRNKNLS